MATKAELQKRNKYLVIIVSILAIGTTVMATLMLAGVLKLKSGDSGEKDSAGTVVTENDSGVSQSAGDDSVNINNQQNYFTYSNGYWYYNRVNVDGCDTCDKTEKWQPPLCGCPNPVPGTTTTTVPTTTTTTTPGTTTTTVPPATTTTTVSSTTTTTTAPTTTTTTTAPTTTTTTQPFRWSISFSVSPGQGEAPLNNVNLTARVNILAGTQNGQFNYLFNCGNGAGIVRNWTTTDLVVTVPDGVCGYANSGEYIASVTVTYLPTKESQWASGTISVS